MFLIYKEYLLLLCNKYSIYKTKIFTKFFIISTLNIFRDIKNEILNKKRCKSDALTYETNFLL